MVPVIAAGLRRDLAHVRAEERAASSEGDEHRAMRCCCEAAVILAEIAEMEAAAPIYAASVMEEIQ